MSSENELPGEIRSWLESLGKGRLVDADRRPGGGRREAWFVDFEAPTGDREELFMRLDRSAGVGSQDPYDTRRETDVFLALHETALPIPRIHAVFDSPQAVLSDRSLGETWFSRIRDPEEQLAVATDFIGHLATMHRLDPSTLEIPALGKPGSVVEHVREELDLWRGLYESYEAPRDPLIEFAFDWLSRNVPDYDGPVVLVQGDTGPGNFLYADGRVVAILDFELAHWGDPMDDLAWLSLRATQEPFTHFPDRVSQYAEASGHPIDENRIRYHRVFAELRIAVMHQERAANPSSKGEVGNSLIYDALHNRLLVETLVDVLGLDMKDPILPDAPSTEREWLYDAALDQIREVVLPRSEDPLAILRLKGLARILKHLRDGDRLGRSFESQDLDDLEALLGSRPTDVPSGREALAIRIEAGDLSDEALVAYFHRATTRRTALVRSASGALADRHYPPLLD